MLFLFGKRKPPDPRPMATSIPASHHVLRQAPDPPRIAATPPLSLFSIQSGNGCVKEKIEGIFKFILTDGL
jgi:hypothetical protein